MGVFLRLGGLQKSQGFLRLLEQPEGLGDGLGRVALAHHLGHPLLHDHDVDVAQPHVADVAAYLARLVAVAHQRRLLDRLARLLDLEEVVEEVAHVDGRADRPALALEVQYQLVALPLGLLLGLRLDGMVGRHGFARRRVLVGENHLPFVGVPAPA